MYPASFFVNNLQLGVAKLTQRDTNYFIITKRNKERKRRLPYGWKTKAIANANAQKAFVFV